MTENEKALQDACGEWAKKMAAEIDAEVMRNTYQAQGCPQLDSDAVRP